MSTTAPGPEGRVLAGRYLLERRLADGGMASVWEAVDQTLGRHVAVKVLHPHVAADPDLRARFHTEAVAAARLVDPAIVAIFDTCHDGDTEAIVMELVRGRNLRDYLDERGHLEPVEVVHIGAQVASALTCAHRAGVVHRDIKPANILLSDDGRVLVTDFGIAKVLDEPDHTRTSTMLGTVKYLAPEQVEGGPVDARTDVYALGAVLYECLAGEPPFRADSSAALALARLQRDPLPPSAHVAGVPPMLDALLLRALARRPEHRFATAADLRAALLATRLDVAEDATVSVGHPDATTSIDRGATTAWAPEPGPGWAPAVTPTATVPAPPRRPTAAIVVTLVVVLALLVAALLVATTDVGRELFDPSPSAGPTDGPTDVPATVTGATAFDPRGGDGENSAEAVNAVDGDPSTSWSTETYATRSFGNLKEGVGLVTTLDRGAELEDLTVRSPTVGWSAQVYVAASPADTLAGWGEPVATVEGAPGDATVDLGSTEGAAVLVWVTDLGDGPAFRFTVSELELRAS